MEPGGVAAQWLSPPRGVALRLRPGLDHVMGVSRAWSPAALLLVSAAAGAEMDETACRALGFVRAHATRERARHAHTHMHSCFFSLRFCAHRRLLTPPRLRRLASPVDPQRTVEITVEYDVVECADYVEDMGAWARNMPEEIRRANPNFVPT